MGPDSFCEWAKGLMGVILGLPDGLLSLQQDAPYSSADSLIQADNIDRLLSAACCWRQARA